MTNEIQTHAERKVASRVWQYCGDAEDIRLYVAEIAELRAKVESLAADAERYQWLREKRDIPHGERNIPWVVALDPSQKIHTSVLRVGAELDLAIDAAMAKEKA